MVGLIGGWDNSMDVDLSRELLKPSKATLEFQVTAARRAAMKGAAGKVRSLHQDKHITLWSCKG